MVVVPGRGLEAIVTEERRLTVAYSEQNLCGLGSLQKKKGLCDRQGYFDKNAFHVWES